MSDILSRIRAIKLRIPEIQKVFVPKRTFDEVTFALSHVQRFGCNGPTADPLRLFVDEIEIMVAPEESRGISPRRVILDEAEFLDKVGNG